MSSRGNISDKIRGIFDDGLDEVLIFAIVFIFVLISGRDNNKGGSDDSAGILPLLITGAFLLVFAGYCRDGETHEPA
jgi:hypothetical protein